MLYQDNNGIKTGTFFGFEETEISQSGNQELYQHICYQTVQQSSLKNEIMCIKCTKVIYIVLE